MGRLLAKTIHEGSYWIGRDGQGFCVRQLATIVTYHHPNMDQSPAPTILVTQYKGLDTQMAVGLGISDGYSIEITALSLRIR